MKATRIKVSISNVIVFLSVVIPRRIPPTKWALAWKVASDAHQRDVQKMLTQLTMEGKIKRRVVDGEFIYYPIDEDES